MTSADGSTVKGSKRCHSHSNSTGCRLRPDVTFRLDIRSVPSSMITSTPTTAADNSTCQTIPNKTDRCPRPGLTDVRVLCRNPPSATTHQVDNYLSDLQRNADWRDSSTTVLQSAPFRQALLQARTFCEHQTVRMPSFPCRKR